MSIGLVATTKTSTLQKELGELAATGFNVVGQTVFESMMGGKETASIVEKRSTDDALRYEYKLIATSKTSTLQKEIQELRPNAIVVTRIDPLKALAVQ